MPTYGKTKVYLHLEGSDFCAVVTGDPPSAEALAAGFLDRLRRRRPDIAAPASPDDCTLCAAPHGRALSPAQLAALPSGADVFVRIPGIPAATATPSKPEPEPEARPRPAAAEEEEEEEEDDTAGAGPLLSIAKMFFDGGKVTNGLQALRSALERAPRSRRVRHLLVARLLAAHRYVEVCTVVSPAAAAADPVLALALLRAAVERPDRPAAGDAAAGAAAVALLERIEGAGLPFTAAQRVELAATGLDILVAAARYRDAVARVRAFAAQWHAAAGDDGGDLPPLFVRAAAPALAGAIEEGTGDWQAEARRAMLMPLRLLGRHRAQDDLASDLLAFARVVRYAPVHHELARLAQLTATLAPLADAAFAAREAALAPDEHTFVLALATFHALKTLADGCLRHGALEACAVLSRQLVAVVRLAWARLDDPARPGLPLLLRHTGVPKDRELLLASFLDSASTLAQAYETLHWFGPALRVVHDALAAPPVQGACRFPCAALARFVEPLLAMPGAAAFFAEGRATPLPASGAEAAAVQPLPWTADLRAAAADRRPYSRAELDVLSIALLGLKLLFRAGYPQLAAAGDAITEPLILQRDLHLTLIRNSAAYHSVVVPYALRLRGAPVPFELPRIYVVGDSHSLTCAWHTVTLADGQRHLLCTKLVTGCKVWHMRRNLFFIPNAEFWHAVAEIPPHARVIMLFGEIDCREGVVGAVESGRYATLEEGYSATLDVYEHTLALLQAPPYSFDLYVHPAIPGVDVTRAMVHTFDTLLRDRIRRLQSPTLHFLDIVDQLVTDDWSNIRPELRHDGTHINPDYVAQVLEPALREVIPSSSPSSS